MPETMYLSRLKIISPHTMPNTTAPQGELNTVHKAYPPEKAASNPVKKIVAPMPPYLFVSDGALFNIGTCTPEQNRKKSRKRFMIIVRFGI
jgi:hypothetical protein